MGSLKTLVYELERKAKAERDHKRKAEFHQEAARNWRKIGRENGTWEKHWKWNMANYYSAKGHDHLHSGEFEKAKKCFAWGEKLFLDLKMRSNAFHCGDNRMFAYYNEEKGKTPTTSFLESQERFLKEYEDFSGRRKYIRREHRYWNTKGKMYRREMRFGKAAECYKKSVEIISEIDENEGQSYLETYYKCKAMENKDNKAAFEENINKAIEISEKRENLSQMYYHVGLKYEILGLRSSHIEEKIEFFKRSKENYYRAEEEISAKRAESLYLFNLSQKALEDGTYEKAIDLLEKTAGIVENPEYPSRIPFPRDLESERCLYNAYLCLSRGEFSNSAIAFEKWLRMNKGQENTTDYASNEKIKMCIELYDKEDFSEKDLYDMDKVFEFVKEKQLGSKLYLICSLAYAYVSLCLHGIKEKEILEKIKLETVRKIATDKVADNMKWLLDMGAVGEESDLLQRLPPILMDEFDKCRHLLENILPECRSAAMREFYVFLEDYLRIVVFFNAEIFWGHNWALKLEERIAKNTKHFDRFTLGDLIYSLRFLRDNKAEFCKNIPEEIFGLMETHSEIRNRLSHHIAVELPSIDIRKDISKVIFMLFSSFPTCIRVYSTQRSPWYDAEILWNYMPKRVSVYSEKKLSESYYFVEPTWKIQMEKLHPRVSIPVPPIRLIEEILS